MPGCFRRNSTPTFTSSGIVSKRTAASLLSDRGFMQRTANPRADSSLQASAFMKFDVRCITRIPTWGAGFVDFGLVEGSLDRCRYAGESDVARVALGLHGADGDQHDGADP